MDALQSKVFASTLDSCAEKRRFCSTGFSNFALPSIHFG
jgi:hypothetical protein